MTPHRHAAPNESPTRPRTHHVEPVLRPVQTVHDNGFFAVRDRDGYFSVDYATPVVGIAVVVAQTQFALCRVRRPILDAAPWEIPAGGIDGGETPAQGAARELREETGIVVTDLARFQALPTYAISPRMPVLPHAFRIDLSEEEWQARGPHDHEVCEVACFDFARVREMIAAGDIWMAETIVVLARVLLAADTSHSTP